MSWIDSLWSTLNPAADPNLLLAKESWEKLLPTLWLLGRTGAGKSSLIRAITGNEFVEIGTGFRPCTQMSSAWDFPQDRPVVRFLDTRGIGEASYDAQEDISACQGHSHALIVVMRLDDPNQHEVLDALWQINTSGVVPDLLLVHTHALQVNSEDRHPMQCLQQEQVKTVWGRPLVSILVDFEHDDDAFGMSDLIEQLCDRLPMIRNLATDKIRVHVVLCGKLHFMTPLMQHILDGSKAVQASA